MHRLKPNLLARQIVAELIHRMRRARKTEEFAVVNELHNAAEVARRMLYANTSDYPEAEAAGKRAELMDLLLFQLARDYQQLAQRTGGVRRAPVSEAYEAVFMLEIQDPHVSVAGLLEDARLREQYFQDVQRQSGGAS